MTYTSPKPAWEAKNAVFWQDTPNLHILKKNQHVDAKSAQHLHILKKFKSFDSEKSPNLHILKKIKKIKNLRLYVGLTGIDELVFDFFEYMQVWWLFTIKTFDFFEYMQVLCAFGIKMLILIFWVFAGSELFPIKMFVFFEYMQVWGTWGSPNLHVLKKDQRSGAFPYQHVCFLSICRFERLEVHQTCIYSKKINMLMPKVHKTCIYSKKSKVSIVKSHQTCIYSKKSKKTKISDSMWDWLA